MTETQIQDTSTDEQETMVYYTNCEKLANLICDLYNIEFDGTGVRFWVRDENLQITTVVFKVWGIGTNTILSEKPKRRCVRIGGTVMGHLRTAIL